MVGVAAASLDSMLAVHLVVGNRRPGAEMVCGSYLRAPVSEN